MNAGYFILFWIIAWGLGIGGFMYYWGKSSKEKPEPKMISGFTCVEATRQATARKIQQAELDKKVQ